MIAVSSAVQLLRVGLDRVISHANCVLEQIHGCASGPPRSERSMSAPSSHMPNRLSPSQIKNLVLFVVSSTRSCSVLADVPPCTSSTSRWHCAVTFRSGILAAAHW